MSMTIPTKEKIRPGEDPSLLGETLKSIKSGKLYAFIKTKGYHKVSKLYPDIVDEINKKVFATMVRSSYSPIPKYYTIPMNRPYIDLGATDPYARKAKQPPYNRSDQTPELLLEPFGNPLVRAWSTMSSMIDMHSKKLDFVIIKDDDVIEIYHRLTFFLRHARRMNIPPEAIDYIEYLNRMVDFVKELEHTYQKVCNRKKIKFIDGIRDIFFTQGIAL